MSDQDVVKFFIVEKIKTEERIDCDHYYADRIRYDEIAKISDPFTLSKKEFTELSRGISKLITAESHYSTRVIELVVFEDKELTPDYLLGELNKVEAAEKRKRKAIEAKKAKAAATRKKNQLAKKQAELEKLKKELNVQ